MIIPVTTENIDDCVAVFMKAYNQPPWNYHWTYEKAKQYLSEYVDCKQFVGFVLYDQDQAAGAILCHGKTWWTNHQLMVDEFFISPEKQRIGYGKKLLDHCDQYAIDENIRSIILMTNKYMPAYRFYDKTGFTTTEQYVFMFKQVLSNEVNY